MIPKFRAWYTPFKGEEFGQEMKYGQAGSLITHAEMSPDKYILMQSTGLKDKNGVVIFEGDVVFRKDGECSFKGIVKKDRFYFYIEGTNIRDSFSFEDVADVQTGEADLEVIGNIYENSKLLEEQR